jgi:hypothetical protein
MWPVPSRHEISNEETPAVGRGLVFFFAEGTTNLYRQAGVDIHIIIWSARAFIRLYNHTLFYIASILYFGRFPVYFVHYGKYTPPTI